jgi:hypothetical protein
MVLYSPDVTVCLDACFALKRCESASDPKYTHPSTKFVSPETLASVKALVDRMQPSSSQPKTKHKCKHQGKSGQDKPKLNDEGPHDDTEEDIFNGDMPIPHSVLKECKSSFLAADESRIKASMQFFDDMGLMALLCRDDHVLWVTNMKTAGERQFYAIALLMLLFQHLPLLATLGMLYNVACKLHESCVKWGFLNNCLMCIIWAVSVFHAYAHQWACQLCYHPRKHASFGLSNGEGCERLWSLLKRLIPGLCVSEVSFCFFFLFSL